MNAEPSGAPLNLQAVGLSISEIELSWDDPDHFEQNGPIIGFYIYIQVRLRVFSSSCLYLHD